MKQTKTPLPQKIITPRLVLRPLVQADIQQLYNGIMASYENFLPWLPWVELYKTEGIDFAHESIAKFEEEWTTQESWNFGCFADGNFVGMVGLMRPTPTERSIEVGYWCITDQQGKGYITEAVNAVIRYGFSFLELASIVIIVDTENTRSARVAERLNFILEKVGKDLGLIPGHTYKKYRCMGIGQLPELTVLFEKGW